jgi:subtilisin-like proprotein convertase family protein
MGRDTMRPNGAWITVFGVACAAVVVGLVSSGCGKTAQKLLVYTSSDTPLAIPDGVPAGITSQIVASAGGTIARAALVVDVTHTYLEDLSIMLTSSTNLNIDVSSENGADGDDYANTVFASSCATYVTLGTAPFSGCFQPETAFSSLVGKPVNGTWKLRVSDGLPMDEGVLVSWKLVLCTN